MRRFFVGGNWKCNNNFEATKNLVETVYNKLKFDPSKVDVICSPIELHIPYVFQNVQKNVQVSTQNVSLTGFGAFTGELSAQHIIDFGLKWAIIGHSERRQYYGETDEVVANKTKVAIKAGLGSITCIGEKLEEREANQTIQVVETQLNAVKKVLETADWSKVVIAYEPVWAIGTGKVASKEQAQEVHAFIRKWLEKSVSPQVAQSTRVIYGGSVTDKNAKELIGQQDIDGFLVGGASLKPAFIDIVNACNNE